ncbi:MAG: hypothetical protein IJI14_13470 [Anaerolineaceae bacterium]|nr:hypothetical protein [Anaerolineaceae bacterium]
MREKVHVGEWEIDSLGRKYRKVGDTIEYQTILRTVRSGSSGMSSDEYERLMAKNREIAEQNYRKIMEG